MNDQNKKQNDDLRSQRSRQRRIGDQLRRMYDEVVMEPVPDEFLKLLDDADIAAESSSRKDSQESKG
ncbi:MAG: hypothetical protein CME88_16300 [Hirschia sp.]|nr:hypothetical protein [Hirschia sp.]MBF19938.1 hypothetical protein [Hirschia sp.]|tara:strand:- start:453 stop:653 length:201 start_codon:yes stop_codon:yes gene_type:complete